MLMRRIEKTRVMSFVVSEIVTAATEVRNWKWSVSGSPAGAKILINGSVTGNFLPDFIILEDGIYTIEAQKSGVLPASVQITLPPE